MHSRPRQRPDVIRTASRRVVRSAGMPLLPLDHFRFFAPFAPLQCRVTGVRERGSRVFALEREKRTRRSRELRCASFPSRTRLYRHVIQRVHARMVRESNRVYHSERILRRSAILINVSPLTAALSIRRINLSENRARPTRFSAK